MTFLWPSMLFTLMLIPLLVVIYLRLQRRRQRLVARYGSLGFATGAAGHGRGLGLRRHVPPAILFAGLSLLLISLARPQTVVSLPRVEGTIILAFDVSGSMAADDLKPNRMEAAKVAARDFVERQPGSVLIGVVAFSDNGFSVQSPTDDREAILASINRLGPQRGTSLARGLEASLKSISVGKNQVPQIEGEPAHLTNITPEPTPSPTPLPKGTYTNAAIVLLSDGENNENPDPLEAAVLASDRGVRIHTIGIGSPAGAILKIEGFTVRTKLNEKLLQQISAITGGTYQNAANEQELRAIYDALDPELVIKPEQTEVTSLFAGASILVLLIGGMFSLLWFHRVP